MSNESETQENETIDDSINQARRLEGVFAAARAERDAAALEANLSVRLALQSLGFPAHREFLHVMHGSHSVSLGPGSFAALRVIAGDRRLCRKLSGSFLDENLIFLLAHPTIRRAVTRRFILEMNHPPDQGDAADWFCLPHAVIAALECGLAGTKRIRSAEHYLQIARHARQALNSASYRYPPGLFALPAGWRWFETGEDFKQLADYAADSHLHHAGHFHESVKQRDTFLLRDPQNLGWFMLRMSGK